jgi:hypothetical protein
LKIENIRNISLSYSLIFILKVIRKNNLQNLD